MATAAKLDIASKAPGMVTRKYTQAITTTTVAGTTFTASLAYGETFKEAPTVLNCRINSGTYERASRCFVDTVTTTGATVGVIGVNTADLPDSSTLVTVELVVHGRLN